MTNQDSPEFIALKNRIIKGNDVLWRAWEQIKGLAEDEEAWSRQLDRWAQAKEKLWYLVKELRTRFGFYDCLYLDENGKKTRHCLHNADGFFCQVCPCESGNPYWEKELFDLPSPKVTHKRNEQADFIEKLGGRK